MVIATFGPATELAGKKITFENDTFVLEGHGPILAAAVMEYDRQGHLIWINDGTRAWVGAKIQAPAGPATAEPTPPTGAPQPQPAADAHAARLIEPYEVKPPAVPPGRPVSDRKAVNEFLRFRWMITPVAIQAVFWLGLVVTVIASIAIMTRGRYAILLGLLLLVCGSLMVRISCELIILLFRIYESLHSIEKGGRANVA